MPEPAARPRLASRVLRRLYQALQITIATVLVVLGLLASALLALRIPSARAFALRKTNSALAGLFVGRLEIKHAEYLGIDGARGVDLELKDGAGRRVAELRGLDAWLNVPRLVWQLLRGTSPLEIRINELRLNDGELVLLDDGTGSPTLAGAFAPAKPAAPAKAESGGTTRVRLDAIRLRHVWVHGRLAALPVIDADLAPLQAAFRMEPDRLSVELQRLDFVARGFPKAIDPRGQLTANVLVPIGSAGAAPKRSARAHFRGQLLGSPSELDAELSDQELSANVNQTLSPAASVRLGLAPSEWRLDAHAQGRLPDLHLNAHAAARRGRLELEGDAHVAQPIRCTIAAHGRTLDLAELLPDGPSSQIGFESHAGVRAKPGGAWLGEYQVLLEQSRLKESALPELELTGSFERAAEEAPLRLRARGELRERGAPTTLELALDAGKSTLAELTTHTVLGKAPRLEQLGVAARGTLDTHGELDLGRRTLTSVANAQLNSIQAPGVRVGHASVRVSAQGALDQPLLSAALVANDLRVQERKFSRAELRALGPLSALRVTGTARGEQQPSLEWGATLGLSAGLRIRDVNLGVARAGLSENLRVAELDVSRGLRLENAVLDGSLGHAQLSLDLRRRLERVDLVARNVDLARARELFQIALPARAGVATLEAHYDARGGGRGTVRGDLEELAFGRLSRVSVHGDASLERGTARGTLRADLGQAGRFTLTAGELVVPRARGRSQRWQDVSGSVSAEGELDLAGVPELFLDPTVPVERARGRVSFDLIAERERGTEALPRLKARVKTRDLYLVGKRHEDAPLATVKVARRAEPWSVRDMDLELYAELGPDGKLQLKSAIVDKKGAVATLEANADLPPKPFEHLALLRQLPLQAKLSLLPRELAALPPLLRPASEAGRAAVDITVGGTFQDPVVLVKGTVAHFHDLDAPRGRSMDLRVDAAYARTHGEITLEAYRSETRIGALHTTWQGELAALSRLPADGPSPVRASASLELADFPLGVLPGAHALQIGGRLNGKAELRDYGDDAKLDAELTSDTLRIGSVRFGHSTLAAKAARGTLEAHAHILEQGGELHLDSSGSLNWGNRIAPSEIQAKIGTLRARNFRVAALSPLVQGTVNELDGTLDAELDATLDQGKPLIRGEARFAKGTVQLPQIGERFEDVSFSAQVDPAKVEIKDLVAHGTTGKLSAQAAARMNGVQLLDADAHVSIRQKDKIPVTLEGQAIGDAWGNVDVTYHPGDNQRSAVLGVNVPRLHVELPEISAHSVIDLAPNEHVRTGVWREDGKFVTLPVQPLKKHAEGPAGPPLVVELKLGDDVVVKKGSEANAQISGRLRLVSGEQSVASGKLNLRGGTLDVSGKQFHIESGTISFDSGEVSNPTVVASARWDSPADYRVYADFTGQVQKGKLTLHSEPPLTQDQIFSLIMFGTPDGSFGSSGSSGGTAGTAIGVAGGTATAGLNRAIASFTKLDVSTRIDTSTGSARPEIVVQLSPRVAARVTLAVGEPNPGEPPDRTFLTLDFRLKARWALSTLVGDHGQSEVDLIWRKRY